MRQTPPRDDEACRQFLAGLRETGNATLAARATGQSRYYFYNLRKRDAGFAAQWTAIVQPDVPRRAAPCRVTAAQRRRWLHVYAQTGNATTASTAAGMSDTAAYAVRRADADFGADWAAACNQALDRIESRLFDGALNGFEQRDTVGAVTRSRLDAALRSGGCLSVTAAGAGDLIVAAPAPGRRHLAVVTPAGIVHAHAGLRRVVEGPLDPAWTLVGTWRFPQIQE